MRVDIFRLDKDEADEVWRSLRMYHYLNTDMSKILYARYGAAVGGRTVGFCATIQSAGFKGVHRVHRLVVHPDYQGIGIGMGIASEIGRIERGEGYKLTLTTSNPSMIYGMSKSGLWRSKSFGHQGKPKGASKYRKPNMRPSCGRLTANFEYVGESRWRPSTSPSEPCSAVSSVPSLPTSSPI